MKIPIAPFAEKEISRFVEKEWPKALSFLRKNFSLLSEDDYQDIFTDSFLVLYEKNIKGELADLTSSYFIGICKYKAHEKMRANGKYAHVDDEVSLDILNAGIQADKIDILMGLEEDSPLLVERKEALVRQIVRELPKKCHDLLWGFFRDNYSMKMLAQLYNYKSENSVKVTKHRCQEKFRDRFNELKEQLF